MQNRCQPSSLHPLYHLFLHNIYFYGRLIRSIISPLQEGLTFRTLRDFSETLRGEKERDLA